MFLGFFSRVHKNGRWSFRANWGRIFALLVFLGLLAWAAFSSMIYFVFKYSRGFEDITVYDAVVAPFNMDAHRRKVGNFNINSALADFKSGQITDFSKTFGNLVMGVTRAPENIEGRLQLARIYVAMGRPDIAIEKLEQGILFGKENLDFVRLYVRLLLDRMEDAKIVAVGEKLLDPSDPYKAESPQIRAYLAMSLSSVYAMHGDYTKSEKYLKDYKLEKTLPGILRISKNKWEMGKRDEAIQIIADNFQFPENKDPMYALLVNYYTAMNDFETARRYCVLRQSEDPFSPMPKLELIKLLGKSGDTENQNKMIDDYFSQNKRNNTAMIHLANLAADKGDTKLMRKIYENSIKEGFPAGTYCLLLLESMITSGNYKQAVDFSEEILKGKPVRRRIFRDTLDSIFCDGQFEYVERAAFGNFETLESFAESVGCDRPQIRFARSTADCQQNSRRRGKQVSAPPNGVDKTGAKRNRNRGFVEFGQTRFESSKNAPPAEKPDYGRIQQFVERQIHLRKKQGKNPRRDRTVEKQQFDGVLRRNRRNRNQRVYAGYLGIAQVFLWACGRKVRQP